MGDLRTERTYESLKNAFLELLERYRFEEITVMQLCESAGIRRATFYSHFADKFEYLSFFIQQMRNEMIAPKIRADGDGYYDVPFHELVQFFKEHPRLVRNLQYSQMLPTMMDIFVKDVQKNVYAYLLRKFSEEDTVLIEMKANFYAGGIIQLLMLWMKDPGKYPVDQIDWIDFLQQPYA